MEVLNWLDDRSRYLLSCTAHMPVTGDDAVSTFLAVIDDHGAPASTLTANGRVYTARFADDHHVTVADLATGEVLSRHLIDPNRSYWRNQDKEPGRWPGPSN
ncbi:MAG: hypothetical protein LT070_01050 [Solirubrobacteraceae bacterium]|nr:hypothetical protein [Solirubrobacteraceae bacterium]